MSENNDENISNDYIKPIDVKVCDHCKESRKEKIINNLKSLLPSK